MICSFIVILQEKRQTEENASAASVSTEAEQVSTEAEIHVQEEHTMSDFIDSNGNVFVAFSEYEGMYIVN